MGLCESAEMRLQQQLSKKIDRDLYAAPLRLSQKLLLLGKILHNNGFSEMEVEERKGVVYSNTIQSMLSIVDAMEKLGIFLDDISLQHDVYVLRSFVQNGLETTCFTVEVKAALKRLWGDAGVQRCYDQRSAFQLNDSAKYFLDAIDRTSKKDYKPTELDILHTRVPTTGVVQMKFTLRNIDFRIFDVGGQRSERRKWIHCFDDVNAIIFVAAISEYDQLLREDAKSNRIMEALELFDNIVNIPYFDKCSMILFLNKKDLFAEKIQRVSLSVTFKTYAGGLNYQEGVKFIRRQFKKLCRGNRKLYIHETCATDSNQVQIVINSVIDTIVQENLRDTGMI
ncbi:Guanine nucleotide-binding proteinalpha-17 subunit [Toxocara canis]|uniref:Guanine nucleotide-binding proteinalpha-17 subunit n=1 Tax=Toxocara canis TaxID=6265 RepID=A0A0B2V177_TOXCA|nr:Guanine nucleotide-binding proteinalpha-17 subunit [Toxocara canis]